MELEIKPCPFCGGDVYGMPYWVKAEWRKYENNSMEFDCPICGAHVDFNVDTTSEEDNLPDEELVKIVIARGIEKWNRRS